MTFKRGQFTNRAKKLGRYGKNKRFKNAFGSWDSKNEFCRFLYLQDLEKKGTISDLEAKVQYHFDHNGVHIAKFSPDFRYKVGGRTVVEDFKGNVIPRDFKPRVKMLKAFFGLDVFIVTEPTDLTPIIKAKEGTSDEKRRKSNNRHDNSNNFGKERN